MKPYPVAPIRLLIAVLFPLTILAAASFLLVSLADAQTNVSAQAFKTLAVTDSMAHEFTQQDILLVDANGNGRANPGDIIQYTLSFANHSLDAVTGLHITDTIDANAAIIGSSLVVSPLAFDDAETAVINAPLIIPAPGLLANDDLQGPGTTIASYDAATAQGGSVVVQPDGAFHYQPPDDFIGSDSFHYTLTNDAGSDTAVVHLTILHSDLSIGKSVNNPAPFAGDNITYTVRITNEGSIPLTNIIISDSLPTSLTYQDHHAPANTAFNPTTGLWNLPSLGTGQSADLIINMTVDAGTAGQMITNTAVLQSLDQTDAIPHNNSASAAITIREEPAPSSVDIAITKTVNNSTPLAGETIIYTVTATNLGPDDATGIEITDVLPNGVTFVSSNQISFVPPIWAIGSLDANETVTLNITATVNEVAAESIINNTAAVTAVTQTDTNPNNNSSSASITIREESIPSSVDIALNKMVDNSTPLVGDTIIYTITATNLGPNDASGIEITDVLPNGVTFVSSNQISFVPPIWTIGSLDANEAVTLNITATVNDVPVGSVINNTAAVTAVSQPDANPNNNSSSAAIIIREVPPPTSVDISLSKTVDNSTPLAGETIIYTITATNLGPNDATGVQVTDVLPNGVTFVSSNQPNYVSSVWIIGNLDANETATLNITAIVNDVPAGSVINNIATVTAVSQPDSNPNNNSSSATITIRAEPTPASVDISLSKTVNNSTPLAGDTIIYTITATNLGPDDATGVEITDVLPNGITFVSSNQISFVPPIWSIGNLDANQTVTLLITAIVNDVPAGSVINNTAAVTAVSQPDANPNNNSSSAAIIIREVPPPTSVDISLSKTVDNSTPLAGDTIIYTITATNLGPNDASGVQVTDALPNGVTFVSSNQPNYVSSVWTIGNLDANETVTLNITTIVNDVPAGSVINNTAAVTAVSQPDSNPNNNSASATITIREIPTPTSVDIALSKTVNNSTPLAGDTIIYTITATNLGPNDATGVQVTDVLPNGVTFVSSNQPNYVSSVWTIGSLDANETATLNITAIVNDVPAGSVINNIATVTAVSQPDSNPNNNSASATITIREEPTPTSVDISLSKTVNNNTPLAGDTIIYTITATNLGPDDATGVEITDILPNGITFVSSNQASFVPPIWSIGNLDANEIVTLNITATVNDVPAGSVINNTAAVTAVSQPDANPNNNSASAAIIIHKAPTAVDDDPGNNPAYEVSVGTTFDQPSGANDPVERNDDVGFPAATITSFGGGSLGGSVTSHPAGSTVAPLPTFSDGSLTVYANGRFTFTPPTGFLGNFQFRYRLSNSVGTSDATVTIRVQEVPDLEGPDAVNDPNGGLPANSTPGSTPYHLQAGSSNNVISSLLNNDTLGNPVAALSHFGGGSLGGSVTGYTAGQTTTNNGHSLRVNSDGSLTYTPPAAFTGLFTFHYRLTNSQGTDDATVTIAVGERPSCANDSYTATGNIHISHTASTSVLANDADDVTVTAVQNGPVGTTQNSSQNGQIGLQADGRFVYDPPPGFNGQDSFTYTINNGFADPQTCTATIIVSDRVWFIDSSASGTNHGTLSNPFTSIAAFNSANGSGASTPAAGDLIYLLQGSGYNEADGINLLDNQRLIGQRINLETVINTDAASLDLPPFGTARTPLLQTTGGNGIDLAANNTIRGLDIGHTSAGFGLDGTAVRSPIINQVNITGTGGALRIDGGNFDNNISFDTLESTASPAQNVQLIGVTGSLNVSSGGGGLNGAADTAVAISGGTISFNYPGSITQNASFPTVEVTSGHSGSLTFGGIQATNGTGLQFNNADGSYTFNGTTTLNGGDAGIDILAGSDGAFTFNNATITNPSGTSFWLQSSTVSLMYSGSINDVDDTAVYINNSDNSTITFQSGEIISADRGITVQNSNNSTINFHSDLDLNTGSDDALVLSNNDNSTINFSGDIHIATTTQTGFRAEGGGTVNVTGRDNIINATNGGTAVFIENSNIHLNQVNILNSGSNGIYVQLDGSANMYVHLSNNTISNSDAEGILVNVGAGSNDNGRMDLIMTNNVVNTPGSAADGTRIQANSHTTLCANLSDNQSIGNGAADFHLEQQVSSEFYLQDFATDVTTTLLNKGNSKTGGGVVVINAAGEPFAGGMTCISTPTGLNKGNGIRPATSGKLAAQMPCAPPLHPCAYFDVAQYKSALNSPPTNNQINHTIKTLPAGKTITLRFNVQINTPFPQGSEQISTQAIATATGMPTIVSDDPDTAVTNDPTITPVATIKHIYLPLILNDVTYLPDLIVQDIFTANNDLTIVLKNIGTASVTQEFWVDAYFNPNSPPTGVNQTIQTLDVEGIVWGVDSTALPIAPGETLTLTLNSPYFDAQNSRFSGTIPAGDVYVQVDSANTATNYGAVLEMHEVAGGAYNNIAAITANRSVIIALDNTGGQALINNSLGKRP